ncbi:MAG: VWA domain-containing protein [Pyrinomonadaceae bacterium]
MNFHQACCRSFTIVGILAVSSILQFAQEKDPIDVVKVNTDLVVFDAQVIDKKTKRTIGDLTKADFEITDNGVRQEVSYLSRDELPLSIMLMLDVSGSVRPILHEIRDGALNALMRLKKEDEVAVMAFGTTYNLVQDFTKDRDLISRQIESATANDILGRGTFLASALESAATHMQKAPAPSSRRVIIILTDNVAWTPDRETKYILDELFESGTVVYGLIVKAAFGKVVKIFSFGQLSKGVNDFVSQTGGEIFGADKKEVDEKLGMVIDRLRARYAIGFRPAETIDDGKFRRVEIKISTAKTRKEKPVVITKRGYYLRRK